MEILIVILIVTAAVYFIHKSSKNSNENGSFGGRDDHNTGNERK